MSATGVARSAPTTCPACPHHCKLREGGLGRCRARRNRAGAVVAENYGRTTSLALDPIEKKPLARYRPGSLLVSVGSYGCNMSCPFCQNCEISQVDSRGVAWRDISPERLVEMTAEAREDDARVIGIAHTYNEPLVGWEYVRDTGALAHERGLVNVLVSNGCFEPAVIEAIAGTVDAANIDLKGFTERCYEMTGAGRGGLACVRATIERLFTASACHVEVTTLIVPGMNDGDEEIDELSAWLAGLDGGRGSTEIVYHVTRFFPHWRMANRSPTPVATVRHLAGIARAHLHHVQAGNI